MKDNQDNLSSARSVWVASIISALARAVEEGSAWSPSPSEAVVLLLEIERLRTHNAELQTLGVSLYKTAAAGAQAERAAVVAWLREQANAPHPSELGAPMLSPSGRGLLLLNASAIECGDHHREEKE